MRREGERGAALLTVLMLVSVIAVLAGGALERLRLATRLAGNAAAMDAARGYALAAETLAVGRIDALLGRDANRVTLDGGWSDRPFGLPLPTGGVAVARVTDGGNCFNLNGLVTRTGPGTYATSPTQLAQFARLMRLVGVPGQAGDAIAAATADWIDSDGDQQPSGAEDGAYLALSPGYRTAGTLMADVSELRAVQGVTPELYRQMRPWLCTLPVAAPSTINVNTLPPEKAPLLAMQLPDASRAGAIRQALLQRPPGGYADPGRFWSQVGGASGTGGTGDAAQVGVTTTWFDLAIDVTGPSPHGEGLQEHALIDATRLPAHLVARQWGEAS